MDEYLRRVRRLGEDAFEGSVHAVLGGPEPNVDTVAATLCLALHLSQKEPSDDVCVPVLCGQRSELPRETVRYLQRVKICESSLLWRGDVDLMKLHHTRGLSLTLLRDGLLDSSDCHALESSILRVVHHDRQQDAGDDGASSAVTTVTREILQEAAEHIRAVLGETLGEALLLQRDALWDKQGHQSAQLEELMRSLEQWTNISVDQLHESKLRADVDLEQLLMVDLKEFSDGEMTVAFTSVTTDKEDWHDDWKGLKSFTQRHGYDGFVFLLSISDMLHHPYQQVAVYSNNTDISDQICCELEESSSWSLSCELDTRESVQVYRVPVNTSLSSATPPLLAEEIQALLKDFFDGRRAILSRHPSRRTSSTEGVAGSVEFSQGSSGINDMDGSDIERAEGGSGDAVALARVIEDVEAGTGGVGVGAGGELVSPDSGMTTIRSSRSSKESSVFLSDDSPVAEAIAGGPAGGPGGLFLRNPSPLGLLSLSPPVPPERRKHCSGRNKSDNIDLFSFDPLHGNEQSMPTCGVLKNSRGRAGEDEKRAESSSFSELEELSMLDFSAPNSLGMLESKDLSMNQHFQIHGNDMTDTMVPPTPVNSVVGSCPPSTCGVRFFPEDIVERINGLQYKDSVSSSLSETWDELGFDTIGALSSSDNYTWNRTKESGSPENILEEIQSKKKVDDVTEQESKDAISQSEETHQKRNTLEPMLSLVTEQTESYENWNPGSIISDQWNPVTLACLQLTPPEEDITGKSISGIIGLKEKTMSRKKAILSTLTPDTSKEEDEGAQGKKEDRQMELLDFWTYSAQKGFLKSDSGTSTSYPESLDMWNMTIRDDSLSPLTTPENLSETSGSFCGVNPNTGAGTSIESPIGFSDGGMAMWNTTIREDSSPSLTSPEGAENGKDHCHDGSLDGNVSPKTDNSKQVEEENGIEDERCTNKVITQTLKDGGWKGIERNVKIVIEVDEGGPQCEERGYDDTQSVQNPFFQSVLPKHSDDGADMWEIPVSGMVTSTSEYDNVGAGAWSRTPSPETFTSPVVDMIELEGQYSPFVALTKPKQIDDRYQKDDTFVKTDKKEVISDKNKLASQVFLFEGNSELGHMTRSDESKYGNNSGERSYEDTYLETSSNNSPFVLVDYYPAPQGTSSNYYSSAGEDALSDQSLSRSPLKCDHFASEKQESTSSSHDLPIPVVHIEDGTFTEIQGDPTNESIGNLEGKTTEPMSLSSSSGGEFLKNSPDSLHPGSRDDLKSNSDGDSSSGLEMEYIIVSGTVKEVEKDWHDRPHQGVRQSKGTITSMETFSMLSYAATVLRAQARAANREDQENTVQDTQHRMIGSTDSVMSADTEQSQADSSTHYHTGLDNATEHPVVPEMTPPSQLKHSIQAKAEEGNSDIKSSTVASSVSPSLRYPSDHFLKTREEVYVHSQISMEDSDEGGQSPSAPPPCPPSLGDLQVLRGHLERQDSPETTSESQSPVLTNSSVSHTSSLVGTPLSESGASPHKGLGLPFSGDLMEEENDEETQEEDTMEHANLSKLTAGPSEGEERPQLESTDLLTFTEDLVGGSSFQQTDIQTFDPNRDRLCQNAVDDYDYYDKQRVRSAYDCGKLSSEQHIGDHGSSQDGDPPLLRRLHDVPYQFSSLPTNENTAYEWTGCQSVTQGQTQYGYNYHHIDQRTDSQSSQHPPCIDNKSNTLQNTTDVYAEFTAEATTRLHRSNQAESCYQHGAHAGNSWDDPSSMFHQTTERQCRDNSRSKHTSDLQCSLDRADGQSLYDSDHAHQQFEDQPFYRSNIHPEREDHAQYVPEEYLHFLVNRCSQKVEDTTGMMMKMTSGAEASGEMDNREDLSDGSSQRRKLAAPPMDVSLDHTVGSPLYEGALDTEDEALDTGDDLDIDIDELDTSDEADLDGDSEESNLGAEAECQDGTLWRSVVIGEQEHQIDMKCIEPYKRVISHGGYYTEENAIIVFAACFLPDSNCDNYNYIMENLFIYVISTLELMVAEDYMIVYLNGATPRRRMPGFTWMKRCYQMIDRRLKKNLKMFIIVHPSWFIRTLLGVSRPFISSKFCSKIKYVNSLQELGETIPMEYVHIPPSIVKLDAELQDTAAKADKKGNSIV